MYEESGCVKRKRGHLKGKKTYIYVTQSGMEMSSGRSQQKDGGWEKMGRGQQFTIHMYLGNNGHLLPEVMESYLRGLYSIYLQTSSRFSQSVQQSNQ